MKNFILASTLSLLSTTLWSYGSTIELGTAVIPPGEKFKVDISTLPIYPEIYYNIACNMEGLNEDSHVLLETTASYTHMWLNDCTNDSKYTVACGIKKNKEILFGFRNVHKAKEYLLMTNLDFNQAFKVKCVASPNI